MDFQKAYFHYSCVLSFFFFFLFVKLMDKNNINIYIFCKYNADIALESCICAADTSKSVKCFLHADAFDGMFAVTMTPSSSLRIMMHRLPWRQRKDENPVTAPTRLPADSDSWLFHFYSSDDRRQ